MDIYNLISDVANWIGWPLVTLSMILVGGIGYWIVSQRIEGLKDINEYLGLKLKEAEIYSPDILLERLLSRHKQAQEELYRINQELINERQLVEALKTDQGITEEFLSAQQRITELKVEKSKLVELLDEEDIAVYFRDWYLKEGILTIFATDLDWLSTNAYDQVVEVLREKGSKLNLFLRRRDNQIVNYLEKFGANVYQIKPDFKSMHRFSILENNGERSILLRNKDIEHYEIRFEEYKDNPTIVNLALDILENCV